MNPILADIYSTIVPSAPFIIAAYVVVWVVLIIFLVHIARSLKKTEAQVALLEEQMNRVTEVHPRTDGESKSQSSE